MREPRSTRSKVGRFADGSRGARVAMAGELLSRNSALEVLNLVASANWRGELHILTEDAHRTLAIDQGALKYAHSDHPDDRLGQVLYRNGTISRAQLDALGLDEEARALFLAGNAERVFRL